MLKSNSRFADKIIMKDNAEITDWGKIAQVCADILFVL